MSITEQETFSVSPDLVQTVFAKVIVTDSKERKRTHSTLWLVYTKCIYTFDLLQSNLNKIIYPNQSSGEISYYSILSSESNAYQKQLKVISIKSLLKYTFSLHLMK